MSSRESNHTLRGAQHPSLGEISFAIGDMSPSDLDEIMAIEECSFVTPWSRNLFLEEFHSNLSRTFIARTSARDGREIAGYLCAWFVEDEVHILNLACHPRFRRRKVATGLLAHYLAHAASRGIQWAYLEVRRSNNQALALYTKHGLKAVGMRRGYYTDTREDAIVMALEMKPSPSLSSPAG
jgi:ribosomal-protein-alanine N-acetyltransferase